MKETRNMEFKEKITNTFLKTVSAFSNYDGGKILFGLDDYGNPVGIENAEKACLDIENRINDSIKPQPDYRIEVLEGNVIELTVNPGKKKPYMYKAKAFKRNDTSTIEVDSVELTRLILEGSHMGYEELKSDIQNLSFKCLEQALIEKAGIQECNLDVLKTLNLYSEKSGYNIGAALLADENTYPGVDIGVFGESISIIKKRKTICGKSILLIYDEAYDVFRDQYQYEKIEGRERKLVETIPGEAFREAIANALIHRTWDVREHIRVFMFNDRIEIMSPGGLISDFSAEAFLSGNYSKLRNPIIANVFYRLKLIEMFGTGIRRIKELYEESINKPVFEIYDNLIKVTLPVIKEEVSLSSDEKEVYQVVKNANGVAMRDISDNVSFGKSKIRTVLKKLESQNLIYMTGAGKSTKYHRK